MPMKNPFVAGGKLHGLWLGFGAVRRQMALHGCIERLIESGVDARAPGVALELYRHWGDPLDQARESYLRSCFAEFDQTRESIYVAGASLMTLVLGAVGTTGESRKVWCFEQDPHWSAVVRSWINQYKIKNTYVIAAPPALSANLVRYTIDTKRLPKNFSLVLCEGSRATPKSVISTLHHLSGHLSTVFTVLARKVSLDRDGPILKQWAQKNNATFVVVNKRDGFIKISRRTLARRAAPQDAIVEVVHQ